MSKELSKFPAEDHADSSRKPRRFRDHRERGLQLGGFREPSITTYWLTIAAGVVFGVYIRREALTFTFYADDYAQLEMLEGSFPLARAPYDLFNFSDGTAAEAHRLMDVGFYPWWTDPELRLSFLRPLASLTTWLEHRLFDNGPFGYHAHSAAWWCAMALAVGALYVRVLPRRHAIIAFLFVICSIAHEVPFWWICNRSVLCATTLSLLALLAYRRHNITGSLSSLAVAGAALSLAFSFGEYAFCAIGYFIAYTVCCGHGALQRARSLSVVLAPPAAFLVLRALAGASVRNSGVYIDPLGEPLAFLTAALVRIPVLLGDLLFVLQAGHWTVSPPWILDWVERGWVPHQWLLEPTHWRVIQVGIGCFACVSIGFIWRCAYLRNSSSPTHWLTLGSVLSLVPVVGSFPSSRLLVMATVGFSALLAEVVLAGWSALQDARVTRSVRKSLLAAAGCGVFAYHVVVPVALQRSNFSNPMLNGSGVRDAMLQLGTDEAALPGQDMILLSAFDLGSSMYLPATRRIHRRPAPRSCMYLSFVPAPYVLTRESTHAFDIRFSGATVMMNTALEHVFRPPHRPLRMLESIEAGPFRATILEGQNGLPKRVRFAFDQPLDSPSLLFMTLAPDGFKKFPMPPIGGSVEVSAAAVPTLH